MNKIDAWFEKWAEYVKQKILEDKQKRRLEKCTKNYNGHKIIVPYRNRAENRIWLTKSEDRLLNRIRKEPRTKPKTRQFAYMMVCRYCRYLVFGQDSLSAKEKLLIHLEKSHNFAFSFASEWKLKDIEEIARIKRIPIEEYQFLKMASNFSAFWKAFNE